MRCHPYKKSASFHNADSLQFIANIQQWNTIQHEVRLRSQPHNTVTLDNAVINPENI